MQKICAQCGSGFEITQADLDFLESVSPVFHGEKELIPPPTHCPQCRQQRKMAWRSESALYRRTCDKTGKKIVATFPQDSQYTVYSQEAFWSDDWDPRDYGRDFDFNRSFFEQFAELIKAVPQIALLNMKTENSDFCHRIYDGRNNYLSVIALYAPENLLYTYYTMACKDCTDTAFNQYCELCYECIDTEHCYHCLYGMRLRNCRDCLFCEDCSGCSDCFGCKNLNQKQYMVYNEQKTKEEYQAFIESCALDSHAFVEETTEKAHAFFLEYPHRSNMMVDVSNVSGGNVHHCQESHELYDWYESERMRYCALGEKSHDCGDIYGMGVGDFCYESVTNMYVHHALFCTSTANSSDVIYCHESANDTSDCFGCACMKKGKYCILNKQYSQDEYNALVPKIIDHMRKTPLRSPSGSFAGQEWGEFMPMHMAIPTYNESVAQDHYPLTKEEVQTQGLRWQDREDDTSGTTQTIPADRLPDTLADTPDDIANWAVLCPISRRPFKIVKQELEFYRTHQIPIPRLHPDERHRRRIAKRNPRKLWNRTCANCQKDIASTYAPERPEIVWCESCYLEEVY